MAAIDPRAIQSQAYGRYNRVIAYNAQALGGLLTKPYDEDNPAGWGPPIRDDDGNPIIPGTPGTLPNRVLFHRANATQPEPGALVRATTFRAFEGPNILDWRGKEIDGVEGQFQVLHFHGPPGRYFPTAAIIPAGFQSFDVVDRSGEAYESFFYDRNGTVKVEGPPGAADIKGVAIRNQLTDSEEYVVITGLIRGGLQFWVRSRADADDPWTLIGTHDVSGDLGVQSGFAGFAWNVPVHCNRLGTKAVTMAIGGQDGDIDKRNRLFRIEFDILAGSVTTSGIVDVTGGSSTQLTERNNSTGPDIETTPADPSNLPACPTKGSYTTVTTGTIDEERTSITSWAPTAVAFDYKIDTDDELGKIEITPESKNSVVATGSSEETKTSQACWNGSFVEVEAGSTNGSGSSSATTTSDRYFRHTISIDGGRHSATIGPFQRFLDQAGVRGVTSSVTIVADVSTGTSSTTQTLTNGDEFIRDFQMFWTFKTEIQWADIRYGSLVVANRKMFMDRFRFNSQASEGIPGHQGEPAVFLGPIINSTGQFGVVGAITLPLTGNPAWSETFNFRRDTWIESAGFSLKVRDDTGSYAIRTGDPNNIMLLNTLPGGVSPTPPAGTTVTVTPNPTAVPAFLTQDEQVPVTALNRSSGPFGGHDRFGEFFYQHEHGPGNDFGLMRMFTSAFVQFQVIDERTAQADYEFTDPVAAVGIPGDAPGFEPIVLV